MWVPVQTLKAPSRAMSIDYRLMAPSFRSGWPIPFLVRETLSNLVADRCRDFTTVMIHQLHRSVGASLSALSG
jgi:hypothetical protein